ncbi:SCP2 sterol-binding domain-containing protein [Metabacillus schmidteae]|uniref:SCP2 sterol-binding domain-containing protein n=1 Tax=Metabacillus schmidteae TaxID=2730405 RepID=UPI00158B9312|nr:SCP2 sterol-binding domain-containing protein [Metabacillus schmidteae]
MFITDFIISINKADFIKPILTNRNLIVEIKATNKSSYFLELSSKNSNVLASRPSNVDFYIEGEEQDIKEMLENKISLKQLISLGCIKIKGSYRDFLKLDALIKLK